VVTRQESIVDRKARWLRWYATAKQDAAWQERRKAAKRADYQRHRAKRLATAQRWADANRDTVREISRRFYRNHIEAERERSNNKPPEKKREYAKRNYRRSPKTRLYRLSQVRKRQALIKQVAVGSVDYEAIVRESGGICAICFEPVIYEPAHIDHIVPLVAGGSHTQDNLQFTHARCNLAKGAKLLKVG
jgi:5-methylcytosine-specific restriction endonuclease McrA